MLQIHHVQWNRVTALSHRLLRKLGKDIARIVRKHCGVKAIHARSMLILSNPYVGAGFPAPATMRPTVFSGDKASTFGHSILMTKRTTLILTLVICLLVTLISTQLNPLGDETTAAAASVTRQNTARGEITEPNSGTSGKSKRDRSDAAHAKSLRELEQEFDKILPARFPDQFNSLCDASLKPGETLVLGGFRKTKGDYEFTVLRVEKAGEQGASPTYLISSKIMSMNPEKSAELGFSPLLSPARMRIQKSMILPPDEKPWGDSTVSMLSQPSVTTKADMVVSISMGTDTHAHVISMIVNPGNDGQSFRIRTRMESPSGDVGP